MATVEAARERSRGGECSALRSSSLFSLARRPPYSDVSDVCLFDKLGAGIDRLSAIPPTVYYLLYQVFSDT